MMTPTDLYLDLLKKSLMNWLYGEYETPPMDPSARAIGLDWSPMAHCMTGFKRLDHLRDCIETVVREKIAGDVIECGVWRGGASIFMRGVLKAIDCSDRKVYVADSFQGLPPPSAQYPVDRTSTWHEQDILKISKDRVMQTFEDYGLLDSQVEFVEGFFADSLPRMTTETFSVVRIDCDMYQSVSECLEALYPRLSPGGFMIVDDAISLELARKAVHDFRERHAVREELIQVDWNAAYWRKSK